MLANSIVSWLHELLLRSGSESWEWPGELYNLLVTKPQPCCKVCLAHTWMIYSSDGHKKGPLKYFKDVLQTVKEVSMKLKEKTWTFLMLEVEYSQWKPRCVLLQKSQSIGK